MPDGKPKESPPNHRDWPEAGKAIGQMIGKALAPKAPAPEFIFGSAGGTIGQLWKIAGDEVDEKYHIVNQAAEETIGQLLGKIAGDEVDEKYRIVNQAAERMSFDPAAGGISFDPAAGGMSLTSRRRDEL